jgi:hypothetical protein
MTFTRFLIALVVIGLTACDPTGIPSFSTPAPIEIHSGLGPPPGRTADERQARKDYYRGPRGDEF